ncbi:amidase [Acuticoccus sediminis]|uniref:Amidase n=1 Tax=Acuticoccus sediminis TaxID=2184697 RepID=A0A8B2NXC3_9HYPH|nr:amidase [Acuticoccus sediminis]RAI02002.1 amidase [Acuticoccus sediminis]
MEANELTASQAAALMAKGELGAEELARACLARIEAREPAVKAWVSYDPARAIRSAREADKRRASGDVPGPLLGMPLGVKDMIDTAEYPTTDNSPGHFGNRPSHDAHSVTVMKAMGAFVLGKTDTVEFAAAGRKAATHHPMAPGRTPGGSSSGSGAAVGDFQVPLAFGTQTGGSLIRPAAFNGIYALKPTHNLVSWDGARHYSPSLDTIGWYGRSPQDLTLVAEAFRLPGADMVTAPPVKGLKVGITRTHNWDAAAPEGKEALERAARLLAEAGAAVFDLDLAEPFARLNDTQRVLMYGEGRVQFLAEFLLRRGDMHQDFIDRVENVNQITPSLLAEHLNLAARCREAFDALFGADLDVVITPSAPGEAPVGLDTTGDWVMNSMWTVLHAPCLAVPGHKGPNGLPVGVQLIGPRYGDATLLGIAEAIAPVLDPDLKL